MLSMVFIALFFYILKKCMNVISLLVKLVCQCFDRMYVPFATSKSSFSFSSTENGCDGDWSRKSCGRVMNWLESLSNDSSITCCDVLCTTYSIICPSSIIGMQHVSDVWCTLVLETWGCCALTPFLIRRIDPSMTLQHECKTRREGMIRN